MASLSTAADLQEEVSCPICLDYVTDPVSTDCGHNFCRSCITRSWQGIEMDFSCPQCRTMSRQRSLRSNRQLANITEIVRKLSQCSVRPKEENLCEKHEEKLLLFCEEDQNIICLICRESRDHRAHPVIPIEEAAQEYKNKFEMCLGPLKKKLEDLLTFKCSEEKKAEELRNETEIHRQKIVSEFEELHHFLNKEKRILLSRLKKEEKKILERIRENVAQLQEQSSSLTYLISETEQKSQQLAPEFLKDAKDALSRCQSVTVPEPEAVSSDLKMSFQLRYPQHLKEALIKCRESDIKELEWWKQYCRYTVDVTLDPETAHPNLVLSEDRKSVKHGDIRENLSDIPQRFDYYPCVLGCESFTSGRHYWEMEVGDTTDWILGVCKDSVSRKGLIRPSPEGGYWAVRLRNGDKYWAFTSPETPLPLSMRPRAVGILLDYEAGTVSFYNADNKSHLYTFTDTFTETLRPLFRPSYHNKPMRIRPLPSRE